MLFTRCASLLAALTVVQAGVLPHARRQTDSTTEYDYIVVGSGAGGGPLASRLAIGGAKVLLIEAGDDQGETNEYRVPAWQLNAQEFDAMKWDFYVKHYGNETRQAQDSKMVYTLPSGELYTGLSPPAGATPKGILYPRSGTLGGCASHNAMVTVYPFESDWEYIQTLTGDASWSPSNMRKYFQRLENCKYLPNSVVGHGFSGWLKTTLTPASLIIEDQKLLSIVISAASAMGKGLLTTVISTATGLGNVLLNDLNKPGKARDQTQDVWQVPLHIDPSDYSRNTPREFILATANAVNSDGSRKYHLDIQMHTLATKIRFSSDAVPVAQGVEYITGKSLYAADPRYAGASGTPGYVAAGKEVILSAGVYNTPQLLKLSGIGPAAELQSHNIPVLVNLPGVGKNLQDRYEIGVTAEAPTDFVVENGCTFGFSYPDPCLDAWSNSSTAIGKGVYATSGVAVVVSKKSSAATSAEDPDILMLGVPGDFRGYRPGYAYDSIATHNKWSWEALKAHSHNTAGTVLLRSSDPRDLPEINFHSFDEGTTANGAAEKDLQAAYEGIQLAREMFDKLIPLDGKFTEIWPGKNTVKTEAAVKEYIQNEAWGHHASCTCPIGADGDAMAVLDSKFRVRGVKGLRVVDASSFPKIPGTFIVLPTYMLGEKAADVILTNA